MGWEGFPSGRPWGLTLRFVAQGSQRNDYEQVYLRNLDHAPYEETAFMESEGALAVRLAPDLRGRLALGYGTYETSVSDGEYRKDLQAYYTPWTNSGADDSGLYRILRALPERATRREILEMLSGQDAEVQRIFRSHSEPPEGYAIRQVCLAQLKLD